MSITNTRQRATLDAKVKARNLANLEAIRLYWALVQVFTPLVGSAVTKNDGGLLKKHMGLIPSTIPNREFSVYRNHSNYSLSWTVKACVSIGEMVDCWGCVYEETTVYIGKMDGNVLTEMEPVFKGRTDYTAEEILEKRETLEVAQKAYNDAKSALCPFGEYDQ